MTKVFELRKLPCGKDADGVAEIIIKTLLQKCGKINHF